MTPSQIDEVTTFTEYCTARIDRVVQREASRWRITLSVRGDNFVALAIAVSSGSLVHARGSGREPVYAVWDALCRVEQPLREALSPS